MNNHAPNALSHRAVYWLIERFELDGPGDIDVDENGRVQCRFGDDIRKLSIFDAGSVAEVELESLRSRTRELQEALNGR